MHRGAKQNGSTGLNILVHGATASLDKRTRGVVCCEACCLPLFSRSSFVDAVNGNGIKRPLNVASWKEAEELNCA